MSRGSARSVNFPGIRSHGRSGPIQAVTAEEAARRRARNRQGSTTEKVDVTCWCERRYVHVTVEDIYEGKTGSCGHRDCYDPHPG